MMNDDDPCSCVIDCSALHEIATTRSNNLRQLYLDCLLSGEIAVPAVVLKEFKELYAELAEVLEPHISKKVSLSKAYKIGAASIADRLNSGLSRGPYDSETDIYAASIASIESYTLLTTSNQAASYDRMGCDVSDLSTWVQGRS